MDKNITEFIAPIALSGFAGVFPFIFKFTSATKTVNRAAKGYLKFRSHGLEDPIFYINTASSVCVAASVLTSNSSTILKFTSFSILSEPLFIVGGSLSTLSDTLDGCTTWHSPIV